MVYKTVCYRTEGEAECSRPRGYEAGWTGELFKKTSRSRCSSKLSWVKGNACAICVPMKHELTSRSKWGKSSLQWSNPWLRCNGNETLLIYGVVELWSGYSTLSRRCSTPTVSSFRSFLDALSDALGEDVAWFNPDQAKAHQLSLALVREFIPLFFSSTTVHNQSHWVVVAVYQTAVARENFETLAQLVSTTSARIPETHNREL